MSAALAAALGLAEQVMIKINTDAARKLINDVKDKKLQILAEENKGYYSNDPKIELLYQELTILIEAALAEYHLHAAS